MVIAVSNFVQTASLLASWSGVDSLGVAEYPGAILSESDEEIKHKVMDFLFNSIIEHLTKPIKVSEKPVVDFNPEEIIFRGTLEEVNRVFQKKGWTDGLPIIPPSPEKVEAYLQYTSRSSHEKITSLPQTNLWATPYNIAVNAIMAGCRPEFMPLLIAAVKAAGDPEFQLMNLGSTSCKTPWLLVNGPIIKELGIEFGIGTRSKGPNPTIGRAFHLILHNIAGFKPGETWMGSWGYYAPFVLAEDEEGCDEVGWEPYHVEHGFDRNRSTVTVRTTAYWGSPGYPPDKTDPEITLQVACGHQRLMIVPHISLMYGSRNMNAFLITRPTAKVIANGGYSKKGVGEYLWNNTRISGREANWSLKQSGFGSSLHKLVRDGILPEWFDVGQEEKIPLLLSANLIDVVICGDVNRDKFMSLWCNYNRPVTREITY
ncbi:MAG: hypothetical protein JXA79_05330 [Deltaproteobacteria bacterium]|nr:hypothetical protein [Deltaproteobacteria bacterium]